MTNKSNITEAGYLFDECVETTLHNCTSSLEMMEHLFMGNEFEGNSNATEGVHAQLNTIKSSIKYCANMLKVQRKKERNSSALLELLLNYYSHHRSIKLNDLSMCDSWLKNESPENISLLSVEFMECTKKQIREERVRKLEEAEVKLTECMSNNGFIELMDEQAAAQAIYECETTNAIHKIAEGYKTKKQKETDAEQDLCSA